MRIASWWLFMPMIVLLAAGCRSEDSNKPKTRIVANNTDGGNKDAVPNPAPQPQPAPAPVVVPPQKADPDLDRKKGGSSIIGSARGAAFRAERRNELRQIGLFYQQFVEGTPKSGRTKEAFLKYIQRDAKVIHDTIAEGYYQMNMRADVGTSTSIIAYERDIDRTGHLCVMGDTSVDYVPLPTLKAALAK